MPGYPAGQPFPDFHAEISEPGIFLAFQRGIVEFLSLRIDHQQRPKFGVDEAVHVFEDDLKNGVQIVRRSQRTRHFVEDQQVIERTTICGVVEHWQTENRELWPDENRVIDVSLLRSSGTALNRFNGRLFREPVKFDSTGSAADMHHGSGGFEESGLTDMVPSFLLLNGTYDKFL